MKLVSALTFEASALATVAAVAVVAAMAGCTSDVAAPDTTAGRATSALSIDVTVLASDAYVLVQADLREGTTPLQLGAGDRLSASLDGAAATGTWLERVGSGYAAELTGRANVLVLALLRDGATSAPSTRLTLPPAFDVVAPAAPVSRSSAFTLSWSPIDATRALSIEATGACISTFDRSLSHDPGTFTVQPADLFVRATEQLRPCDLVFTLRRAGGEVAYDAALGAAGRATLTQERVVRVATTP
jgi:hypothetical protein